MNKQESLGAIKSMHQYFVTSTKCLTEQDSQFCPTPGIYTVAQLVAHTANVIDWFMEGAFRPQGFELDFEEQDKTVRSITSLTRARAWFDKAVASALETINARPESDWSALLPQGPIMGGLPRSSIIGAMMDHSAHHRGALTVYARLLGRVPSMPYGE